LTSLSNRLCNASKRMVRWLYSHLNVYLKSFRAILHDPEAYPDPEEFKPERFLSEDGSVRDDPTLSLVFGFGKRICPGRHFVDDTIFIVTSSVLSVFKVTKARDENGNEIPVKAEVTSDRGIIM
jgi:cytochrome P450